MLRVWNKISMAPHAHEFSINLEKNERKKKITSVHLSSSIEITSYSKVLKLPEISLHTNQKEISHRPLVHIYIYIYILTYFFNKYINLRQMVIFWESCCVFHVQKDFLEATHTRNRTDAYMNYTINNYLNKNKQCDTVQCCAET